MIFTFLKSIGIKLPKLSDISVNNTYELKTYNTPAEFDHHESKLVKLLSSGDKEGYSVIVCKFLSIINAHEMGQPLPEYLINGITKKMMYEYCRKNGSLMCEYSTKAPRLKIEEVLRPLGNDEREKFVNFCIEHSC
jgi:hypothetical protein